jgi:hypothetical protein
VTNYRLRSLSGCHVNRKSASPHNGNIYTDLDLFHGSRNGLDSPQAGETGRQSGADPKKSGPERSDAYHHQYGR